MKLKWLQRYIDELKGKVDPDRRADSRAPRPASQHGDSVRRALDKIFRAAKSGVKRAGYFDYQTPHVSRGRQDSVKSEVATLIPLSSGQRRRY